MQYLHHDQQGSTRLITGPTGKVEGNCSYSAYGVPTREGTAATHSVTTGVTRQVLNASDPSVLIFGISGTPSWEELGEGVAGWGGDPIIFGATDWVREELGINNISTPARMPTRPAGTPG